ncbi:hypothetical protein [Rhodopirellula baltica]|uniref:hypothetical protein n=1 Tax=Rhodopirellula baltica TaxID=265606 RepID=UPI0003259A27|nr:hypothetical protein [Rhodopirellula baltica]
MSRGSAVAPTVAPNSVQESNLSPSESLSDQTDDDAENDADTKKPRKTLVLTGFLGVGDTELESVTSTMSTSEHVAKKPQKTIAKRGDAERLHQCLHQIEKCDDRSVASVLVDAVASALGPDAVERLLTVLNEQTEAVAKRGQ